MEPGAILRTAREAAALSLSDMAMRIAYTKAYLSQLETGRRTVLQRHVDAYERVLGVRLEVNVNRRQFMTGVGIVLASASLVDELAASVASGDPLPLTETQTTYAVDQAIAARADRDAVHRLRRWLDDESEVLRVNSAGILAKLPGQEEAARVAAVLQRDLAVRERYSVAVVARVCSLSWADALQLYRSPETATFPDLLANRFFRETIHATDAGARWCSAAMIQALSPALGR